jgi:glycosyltransferase involved in cell wall biosynthesis
MRLLVVTQYFWPETFRINELVTEFSERGHEVTVLTGWPNYPDGQVFEDYRRSPQAFARFKDVPVVRVPLMPRGQGGLRLMLNFTSFALSASVLGLWKLRGRSFDAILVYEPSPITVGIPGAVMRAVKRAPMALWVLDLWPETLKAVGVVKSDQLLRVVGWLVSWIYKRCDLILAQSRSFMGHIARLAPKDARIEYFPAWADDVFAANQPVTPAAEVPLAPGVFTVLFAGNIGEAQDFPAILDAAERLRERSDIRWVIVGDGRQSDWVNQQIEQRQLTGKVLMMGRHPLERMPSFFAHAHALLVSLKDDPIFAMTIPGKLQAYFGSGIPVLAMLNGEGAQVVQEAQAGLVSPAGDGAHLALQVARLAEMDMADRQRLGDNGRRFGAEQFDRLAAMNRLQAWLASLVNNKQAGALRP